jgi:hypothetical protein
MFSVKSMILAVLHALHKDGDIPAKREKYNNKPKIF